MSTSGRKRAVGAHLLGEEDHRRDADAAAEREQPWPRGIDGEAVADRREHAQRLRPAGVWPSSSSPGPRGLYKNSSQPSSALARMIDNGRRIGTDGSQAMCANVPGTRFARRARRVDAQHELLRRAMRAARGCARPRETRCRDCARSSLPYSHCSFIHCSAIKHAADAVDAALADAAAKIPGSALLRELRLRGRRGQRLVDGRDRQPVALGQAPPRRRARARAMASRAVAFGHADDELCRPPVVDDAVELAPGRLAIGTQRRQRRGGARLAVRGGDADTTEPEIERDEDVAVATDAPRRLPGVQA